MGGRLGGSSPNPSPEMPDRVRKRRGAERGKSVKLLVLGGTRFVGRHLVEAALARGHEVTLFNRGNHPEVFPEVEGLIGDRDGDLGALENRTWDAALDTSGYVPRLVRDSAERLRDAVGHYTFISTVSVYPDTLPPHADEDARVRGLEDPLTEEVTNGTYGGLKVLCEEAVREIYGARSLVIRPGLVVGPYDPTDRFTYWPVRVAEGGEVLAPGVPEAPVQFIDARDLAAWTLGMIEGRETGTYNAVSPADSFFHGRTPQHLPNGERRGCHVHLGGRSVFVGGGRGPLRL